MIRPPHRGAAVIKKQKEEVKMPEWKDIINYVIAIIGILTTGIFSYLVWKATEKSNEVAIASHKLSEAIINSQADLKSKARNEYIRTVLKNASIVKDALNAQSTSFVVDRMKEIQGNCGVTEEKLAEYFEKNETDKINEVWGLLGDYIDNDLKDRYGKFRKEALPMDESVLLRKKASDISAKFEELIKLLKDQLS